MQIQKQADGSVKVVLDSGQSFYVQKGKDPIDGLIDIGLMQQRTAAIIENPTLFEDGFMPETFFYALGLHTIHKHVMIFKIKKGIISQSMNSTLKFENSNNSERGKIWSMLECQLMRQSVYMSLNGVNTKSV